MALETEGTSKRRGRSSSVGTRKAVQSSILHSRGQALADPQWGLNYLRKESSSPWHTVPSVVSTPFASGKRPPVASHVWTLVAQGLRPSPSMYVLGESDRTDVAHPISIAFDGRWQRT